MYWSSILWNYFRNGPWKYFTFGMGQNSRVSTLKSKKSVQQLLKLASRKEFKNNKISKNVYYSSFEITLNSRRILFSGKTEKSFFLIGSGKFFWKNLLNQLSLLGIHEGKICVIEISLSEKATGVCRFYYRFSREL